MRHVLTTVAFAALLLSLSVVGQEVKSPVEPEYLGVYHSLDAGKGSLVALERQSASYSFKMKAMGFGGGKSSIEIKGGKSPVRFKADQEVAFVVRVGSQQIDPASIVQFVKFDAKKDKRVIVISKVGAMGVGGATTNMNANAVSFNAAKYGDSSFKIVPAAKLPPGEYGLSGAGSNDVFCFGIDPEESK